MTDTKLNRGNDLGHCVRRVLRVQFWLALGIGVVVLGVGEGRSVLATGYGSLLAIVSTLITARSANRSGLSVESGSQSGRIVSLLPVYIGLVNKLLVVAGGIALGIALLNLQPLFLLLGFAVLQVGFLACRPEVPED